MRPKEWIGIILGLALAGLGKIPGVPPMMGVALIVVAFLIGFGIVVHSLARRRVRIYLSSDKARDAAKAIYEEAVNEGGDLAATHIFPRDSDIATDMAIQALRNINPKVSLSYKRVLIVNNQDLERRWVNTTYDMVSPSVECTLYLLGRHPLLFPSLVQAVIPRVNLLLYKRGNRHINLVGLDRLRVHEESGEPNFACLFHSKHAYELLSKYLNKIAGYGEMMEICSKQTYETKRGAPQFPPGAQLAIQNIAGFAEAEPDVVFAGLFGSIAKSASGLHPRGLVLDHESDVDLLLVYCPTRGLTAGVIKKKIERLLHRSEFDIVWGDDDAYFYGWRAKDKVSVDIELHEQNSSFYRDNALLGSSIFNYFLPLYASEGMPISELLDLPSSIMPSKRRWVLMMDDRKGLKDFQSRLGATQPSHTDPRRIVSLVLRNMTWAYSGYHPPTARVALDFLTDSWNDVFPGLSKGNVQDILQANHDLAYQNRQKYLETATAMVTKALDYSAKQV